MKKALLLLLVGFMAIAPMTASASVRTEGMGVLPQQVEDLDLIWLFPQKIEEYSLVDFRMEFIGSETNAVSPGPDGIWDTPDDIIQTTAAAADEWGGIIHKDAYIGNWGLYVGRPFNGAAMGSSMYQTSLLGSIVDGVGSWNDRLSIVGSGAIDMGGDIYDPENKFDLFKAFAVGNGVLGLRLNYAHSSMKMNSEVNVTSATPDYAGETGYYDGSTSVIALNVGYGMKDLGPFNALDLGLGYAMGSYLRDNVDNQLNVANTAYVLAEQETLEDDGISEITFNARAVKEASENTNLVTNLAFRTSKLALEYTDANYNADGSAVSTTGSQLLSTVEHKNTFIGLGLNCTHKVNGGTGLVVGGLNFQYAKGTWTSEDLYNDNNSLTVNLIDDSYNSGDEMEMTWMGVWANVGVEANLKSWLQVRAGLSHELIGKMSMTMTDVDTLNATSSAFQDTDTMEQSLDFPEDTVVTFGLGVSHKNWNVDLLVSKDQVEEFLGDGDFGEGLLYSGSVISAAKAQIKYNF